MPDNMQNRLIAYMARKNLKAKDVAKKWNCSESLIYKYRRGHLPIPEKFAIFLAEEERQEEMSKVEYTLPRELYNDLKDIATRHNMSVNEYCLKIVGSWFKTLKLKDRSTDDDDNIIIK